jgi:hypothetical protein
VTVYYPTFKPAVSPLTMVSRVRALPYAGEVLVRMGNRVEPDEIVARTLVPGRGRRYPVARILGIARQELHRHLVVEDGDEVLEGDTVVRVGRWRQRNWRSPVAGTLSTSEVEQGYLSITPPSSSLELRALLKGFVTAVEPYRSVTIQTPAALLQGAFGFGGERNGVLRMMVTDEADELLPEMIDERSAFSILIGGGPIGVAAIRRAIEIQARGIIVGSITEESLRTLLGYTVEASWQVGGEGWAFPPGTDWLDFPLTLVVTEGLGSRPMCQRAFDLLASHDSEEVLLDGQTWLHGPGMRRPQVIVPLLRAKAEEIPEDQDTESLSLGDEVRLLGADRLGQVGTLVGFPRRMRFLACGAGYQVAQVRLGDGQIVQVPFENLEVLQPPRE